MEFSGSQDTIHWTEGSPFSGSSEHHILKQLKDYDSEDKGDTQ